MFRFASPDLIPRILKPAVCVLRHSHDRLLPTQDENVAAQPSPEAVGWRQLAEVPPASHSD